MPDSLLLVELGEKGALTDIGRAHAELRIVGKHLAVRPVDEQHQVWIRRWRRRARLPLGERRLRHGDDFTPVDLRDTLILGKRLELRRSGRSIAEAEALATVDASASWRKAGTTP